jgi:putative protease
MKKNELLAPVGSKDAFYTAISAGADAIYLGGKNYNARNSADNFSEDELKEMIEYAHLADVKVYITLNTLLKDSELKKVLKYAEHLYSLKADALIVQDLGLIYILNEYIPEIEVHVSTQMTLNDFYSINLLKKYGVNNNILSREVQIEKIREIKEKTGANLEAFIHGALCCSYSGQCYISSFFGGRSGNRGRCAQTCRLAYDIFERNTNEKINDIEVYPFSMKELRIDEKIIDLADAGISTFKIEGRMRKPEYVDRVVRYYRGILDGENVRSLRNQVTQVFNRGFTEGFMFDKFGKDMISYENPKNFGIRLGEALDVNHDSVNVLLYNDLYLGDGVTFGKGKNNKGFIIDNMNINGKRIQKAVKGKIVNIKTIHKILKGEILYKTTDKSIADEVKDIINKNEPFKKRSLNFIVDIKIGSKIKLYAESDKYKTEVLSDTIVEKSNKIKVKKEDVIEQLSKLGGTVFNLNNVSVVLDEDAFVSKGLLNSMRRQAVENIEKLVTDREVHYKNLEFNKINKSEKDKKKLKISLSMYEMNGFFNIDFENIDLIYIPYYFINEDVIEFIKDKKVAKILSFRNASKVGDLKYAMNFFEKYKDVFQGVQVNDLDGFAFAKEMEIDKIYTDYELNIMNSFSARLLEKEGGFLFSHSIESSMEDIRYIIERNSMESECVIYSNLSLMTIRNCPFSFIKNCTDEKNCDSCDLYEKYYLKDRKDQNISMTRNRGITTVYNPVPLNMIDRIREFEKVNCEYIRIDAIKETDINSIVEMIMKGREELTDNSGDYTRGYYFKDIQ